MAYCKSSIILVIVVCFCGCISVNAQNNTEEGKNYRWSIGLSESYINKNFSNNAFYPGASIKYSFNDKLSMNVDLCFYYRKDSTGSTEALVMRTTNAGEYRPVSPVDLEYVSYTDKEFYLSTTTNAIYSVYKNQRINLYTTIGATIMFYDWYFTDKYYYKYFILDNHRHRKGASVFTKYSVGCEVNIYRRLALNVEPALLLRLYSWGDKESNNVFLAKAALMYRF